MFKIFSFDRQKQIAHFDNLHNRYQQSLILLPPFHTALEIKKVLQKLKLLDKDGSILDFGAGSGRLTIPLLKEGFRVWAFDISQKSLADLCRLAQKQSLTHLHTSLTFPNKKFTAIVGSDILHHVSIEEYLPQIRRALKPKGKIVFSEPGGLNPTWYIFFPFFIGWDVEKGVINNRYFNLRSLLKKNGFKNVKIEGLGLLPRPFFNWSKPLARLNDKLGNLPLMKLFAYRYVIEAST